MLQIYGIGVVISKILIVDDNSVLRRSLAESLSGQDDFHICGEAADGLEGIERARALLPDVIILDVSMPVMNGFEAARILKQSFPSIAVIIFTSFEGENLRREAESLGVAHIVSKSDSVENLIKCIRERPQTRSAL